MRAGWLEDKSAGGGTRTPKVLRPRGPKPRASTQSSATPAGTVQCMPCPTPAGPSQCMQLRLRRASGTARRSAGDAQGRPERCGLPRPAAPIPPRGRRLSPRTGRPCRSARAASALSRGSRRSKELSNNSMSASTSGSIPSTGRAAHSLHTDQSTARSGVVSSKPPPANIRRSSGRLFSVVSGTLGLSARRHRSRGIVPPWPTRS